MEIITKSHTRGYIVYLHSVYLLHVVYHNSCTILQALELFPFIERSIISVTYIQELSPCIYSRGVNFPKMIENFLFIKKIVKMKSFGYVLILIYLIFQGVKTLKIPPANTFSLQGRQSLTSRLWVGNILSPILITINFAALRPSCQLGFTIESANYIKMHPAL